MSMGIEIERKFLLSDDSWRTQTSHSLRMLQGYLNGAFDASTAIARCSVRVRIAGKQAWLNIKSATLALARDEFEYVIPVEDADRMLDTLCDGVLEKVRHYVPFAGMQFEVDEFFGENAGLVVAELELEALDQPFVRPPWLAAEVSVIARYYNVNLVRYPYSRWNISEKAGES
jgi:adenylate cyclase